jgi:Bifunctional DNA primase/polymerase, N-terminal
MKTNAGSPALDLRIATSCARDSFPVGCTRCDDSPRLTTTGADRTTNGNQELCNRKRDSVRVAVFRHAERSKATNQRPHADLRYRGGWNAVLSELGTGYGHCDGAEMDWTDTWREAFRTELRAEAITFAEHGWPVVPGSYTRGNHWLGEHSWLRTRTGAHGFVPVHPNWRQLAGCGPEHVAALWSGQPFSVLLATGIGVDALDLPAPLGQATAMGLRVADIPVPIAATPAGRWLFPVLGGSRLPQELAEHPDVVLHAFGGWVPLPPSLCLPGVVHWRVKPATWGWKLPRLGEVSDAALAAVHDVYPLATVRRR